MKSIIEGCFKRPGAVILALLLIFFSGINAFLSIPKEASPDVEIPVAYVSVAYEGISPSDAEKLLTKPLEKQLKTVAGLKKMTSAATEGYTSITVEFDAGEDIDLVLEDVRQAVDDAKKDLPKNAEEPKVTEISLALFPILSVSLSGNVPESSLINIANNIKEKVESVAGVLEVEVGGDRKEVIEILIDASSIESYGINPQNVIGLVAANNQLVTAGAIENENGRLVVKVPGVVETLDELFAMPIKIADGTTINFGDIAIIRRTFEDKKSWSRVNGKPAVVLDIKKRVGSNIIDVVDASKKVISEEVSNIPGNINVDYLFDESKSVRNLLNDLGNNVFAAVLIVLVIVVLALGIKNALLIGFAIPSSFLLGFIILSYFGVTMNIIVLFSLILVAGILVDGVIVTTEYADRKISLGHDRRAAYLEGSVRMSWPIIASTVTTLMVFFPLLVWPGIVGQFMKYLPITMIVVLSASLLMALIFIPILGSFLGKISTDKRTKTTPPKLYKDILKISVTRPILSIFLVGLLIVGSYSAYFSAKLGVQFFPDIEPEQAVVQILSRGDLSASEKNSLVKDTEASIANLNGVDINFAKTGADGRTKDLVGSVRTIFSDWDERETAADLMESMRGSVKFLEGANINIVAQKEGPGGQGKPVRIEITGTDFDQLNKALFVIRQKMNKIDGFIDISDNLPSPGLEWNLNIDREIAARHGVTVASLGTMVKLLTKGVKVSDYRPDDTDEELEVFLRYIKSERNLDRLQELRVPTSDGRYVPLSVFAELTPEKKGGTISRLDGNRLRSIEANVKEGMQAPFLIEKLKSEIENVTFPKSVSVNFAGEDEDIKETQAFLGQSLVFSLVLMSIVLMIQFNSAWQTIVTMSAIILSTGGIFLLLFLTERPFGVVMSMLGLIALAGIVVNNNIVLIDTFNEYRRKGHNHREAAYMAGLTRFRPVILTAITTILGLVPMVFSLTIRFSERDILVGAPSSQWWVDLSSTIAGGLTFATFLTLIATPALLVIGRTSVFSIKDKLVTLLKTKLSTKTVST